MRWTRHAHVAVLAMAAAFVIPACGGGDGSDSESASYTPQPAEEFALVDRNRNSATYKETVSPRDYIGKVPGFYFTHANWGYCRSQFGFLNRLQAELLSENPSTKIRLLGLNAVGYKDWIRDAVAGRTLPFLQDTSAQDAWGDWNATWRDLMILDADNIHVNTYNLTVHDLANTANYAELKGLLKEAAREP